MYNSILLSKTRIATFLPASIGRSATCRLGILAINKMTGPLLKYLNKSSPKVTGLTIPTVVH